MQSKMIHRISQTALAMAIAASAGITFAGPAALPLVVDVPLALVAETTLRDFATRDGRADSTHDADPKSQEAQAGRAAGATRRTAVDHPEVAAMMTDARTSSASRQSQWAAVDSDTLDEIRGGFELPMQLRLSFGIERAVYLNGALVTTTSFNLPSLAAITGTGAGTQDATGPLSVANGSVSLLQNGTGNSFSFGLAGLPLAATVIQNSLNNQSIQSLTTINATANSLELLRSVGFQSMVRDGLTNAVVPH